MTQIFNLYNYFYSEINGVTDINRNDSTNCKYIYRIMDIIFCFC